MDALNKGFIKEMRKIKVKRDELLARITENRTRHVAEYLDAVAGYKEEAKEAVANAIIEVNKRLSEVEASEGPLPLYSLSLSLKVPQTHEGDYNQVIEMLKMSVEDELEIATDEFACYVMNKWEWAADFAATNSMYLNKRGTK